MIEPKYKLEKFTCPYCNNTALQKWENYKMTKIGPYKSGGFYRRSELRYAIIPETKKPPKAPNFDQNISENILEKEIDFDRKFGISTCSTCDKIHIWLDEKMIEPTGAGIPLPNEDMNEDIKKIYNEAASVFNLSPKAAGALLRLALQKFLKEQLGTKGKNINTDIGFLVKENKISEDAKKCFDIVRGYGNNGVHPGLIDLDENKESVKGLFKLFNMAVDKTITIPKKLEEEYNSLPEGVLKGIENRDKK